VACIAEQTRLSRTTTSRKIFHISQDVISLEKQHGRFRHVNPGDRPTIIHAKAALSLSVRRIYKMPWFTVGGSKLMAVWFDVSWPRKRIA
jgi:hypothetical protein